MISAFKKSSPQVFGGGDGKSIETAYYWSELATGDDKRRVTELQKTAFNEGERVYIRVNLTEVGEYYCFDAGSDYAFDTYMWLYDSSGNLIDYNDDDMDSGNSMVSIYLEKSGDYILAIGSYEDQESGQYAYVACTPAPTIVPAPQPGVSYKTSTGFDDFGHPIRYDSASSAGCGIITLADKNTLFLFQSSGLEDAISGIVPQKNGNVTQLNNVTNFNRGYLFYDTDGNDALNFGTQDDFTVEYVSAVSVLNSRYPSVIANSENWSNGTFASIRYGNFNNANNGYRLFWNPGDPLIIENPPTTTFGAEIYRHQACVRHSGVAKMFIDGKGSSGVSAGMSADFSKGIWLGQSPWDGDDGFFYGNLLWLRISKGARYVEDFTPPNWFYKR